MLLNCMDPTHRSFGPIGVGAVIVAAFLICTFPSEGVADDSTPLHIPAPEVSHDIVMPVPGAIGRDVESPVTWLPSTPPPDPQVGDSWIWWLWVHDPMPPHFEQAVCTVRGMSDHAYVVVRDEEWLVSVDQADVDMIIERWENSSIGPWPDRGIFENDTLAFGSPPDELDNDPRIYLVWFDFGISSDGFFFWFDEFPEGAYPQYHSNECESLYLNPYSSGGPSGDYMLAVAAHEFEHMIHWKYDDNEDSWVNEGLAEMGMWIYGAPDNISAFNANPDNSLITWDATWADYIKTYLWSLYFYERYGGLSSLYDVVHEPANSIAGYENVLDDLGFVEDFADVFADWTVANYLDDTTIGDGRYGYLGDELPAFALGGTYSTYPVTDVYKTVNHWAADYYRFQALDSLGAISLSFDGADDNSFAVWGLTLFGNGTTAVNRMTLDPSTQAGTLLVTGLNDPDDKVILVVGSASSTGAAGYYFGAQAAEGVEPGQGVEPMALGLSASPNPFVSNVELRIDMMPGAGRPVVEIFDLHGRLVRRLEAEDGPGAVMVWDGCRDDRGRASAGLYLARVTLGGASATASIMLL